MQNSNNPLLHVAVCGSMSELLKMEALAQHLQAEGFAVTIPAAEERSFDWAAPVSDEAVALKRRFLNDYFDIIRSSDVVLVANYAKNGIDGYIGANALMEAACGHALHKPVFFLYPIGTQHCQLEAISVSSGNLESDPRQLRRLLGQPLSERPSGGRTLL